MAKRKKRREREPPAIADYTDAEGNVLTLRESLSAASLEKISRERGKAGATAEDAYRRREEMLFERLVVSWEVAGLPLDDQAMLLSRYRMADAREREWVRRTIAEHVERHLPGL
ncbi:MAG: hypothetical protein ACR2G3_10515 [Solirubrobacterales bacterium]